MPISGSVPNLRAPVITGPINGTRVPIANRADDRSTGFITRGSLEPVVPYGGVAVNRMGVTVNPSQGWDAGSVVRPGTPVTPPVDRDSAWYRRYRDRHKVYSDRYHWGSCGPVFVDPGYYAPVESVYWNYSAPPVFVNNNANVAWAPEPMVAPAEPQEQPAANGPQAQGGEQMLAPAGPAPRRHGGGLTEEKLHELMVEGVQQFQTGKYNEAASTFLRVTLADRQNIDATLAYAVARFATGDYQISGLAIRRAVRRMPEVVNAEFDVRDRYDKPADFANHLERLEWHVSEEPGPEDAWVVLGFIRHFSGQRELAVETFERLRDLPNADLQVVDIFLDAEVVDPAASSEPAARSEPTEVSPMVPSASDRPLPGEIGAARTPRLISVERVE